MALVFAHPDFHKGLRHRSVPAVAKEFAEYHDKPDDMFGFVFGRDKGPLGPPEAVTHSIRHLHMVDSEVEQAWLHLAGDPTKTAYDFTSDTIIFYARLPFPGQCINVFGLLAIYHSPFGHTALRSDRAVLNAYPRLIAAATELRSQSIQQLKSNYTYVETPPHRRKHVVYLGR